ncbi:site-2 protease family protein [Anaerosporobacter sp.]|uniref:site-2 protease family protein n=1 Tax=Anaerosporobacter sp. TaxID=1872529 RepID=UPI00286F3339|nr:site-2 protease family protein [Anaerosporobacter sp.]
MNKKDKIKQFLIILCSLLAGFAIGFLLSNRMLAMGEAGLSFGTVMLLPLLGIFLSFVFQLIIHEAGHLFGGLLTGYHFNSFRIGSFMLLKKDKKLHLRKLSLAGTGGQCLMGPPDKTDENTPYALYLLGGVLFNLITSILSGVIAFFTPDTSILSYLCMVFSVTGIAFAVTNGIPLRLTLVHNDGYDVFSLRKNPEALRYFFVQLKIGEQMALGTRLQNMPEEWFFIPSDAMLKNSLIATIRVFNCNRLLDQKQFEVADMEIERLFQMDANIVGVHRKLLINDQIYCELIGQNRPARLVKLFTRDQKKFLKRMKNSPSVLRTHYVYALVGNNNTKKAKQIKRRFEKTAKSYPYPSEIIAERELMEYAVQHL